MLKKTIRRLGALAMVLAMAVSVFAVNASAANNPATVQITKTLTKSAETPAPNTKFEFKIEAGEPGSYTQAGKTDIAITPGVAMENVTTGEGVESTNKTTVTYTATITLPTYTAAGIYSYKVSEVDGGYKGITYDKKQYTMNVFVNKDKAVYAVTIDGAGLGTAEGKKSLNFTNSYTTTSVTVKKLIKGNQADMDATFPITITINGTAGKSYTVVNGSETATIKANENGVAATTISLGNEKTYTVYGLSATDTYQVTEAESAANKNGYTTTYNEECNNAKAAEVGITAKTAVVTNTKDATAPTGVIMTIAPYALMVVLAGAFAVVFLTRRNRAE